MRQQQHQLEEDSKERRTRSESQLWVPVAKLNKETHGAVLCYPGTDLKSFPARIKQLKELKVREVCFEGSSKVGNLGVIGKGCVSVVLKARFEENGFYDGDVFALKCRRVDANRENMKRDFELQKFANSFGVGPLAICASEDFFAMEFIDAVKVGKWISHIKTRSSKKFLRALIRNSLTQCLLLDLHGLDHGELSNPSKHLLIRKDTDEKLVPKVTIIDYESAATERKVSNVTSVAQFFFLGGWQSERIKKILKLPKSKKKLISLLREYKGEPNRNSFEKLLAYVHC